MKKSCLYLTVILAMLTLGCNSWLDVKPSTSMLKEDMFSTQEGFRDALVGVYVKLKQRDTYRERLMWGTMEQLAQHWTPNEGDKWVEYDYRDKSVSTEILQIYSALYTIIAETNSILESVEQARESSVFDPGWYELIKGEALGIRAWCHFDILRIWGPMPDSIPKTRILPYVKTLSLEIHPRHTYQEYTGFLLKDIQEAHDLLAKVDPIMEHSIASLRKPDAISEELPDMFFAYRQIRMNAYALEALKARLHLWNGEKEKAWECANNVINAKDKSGELMFRLGDVRDIETGDFAFSCEHILALDVYDLDVITNKLFGISGQLKQEERKVTTELFSLGTTDIRLAHLWKGYEVPGTKVKRYSLEKFLKSEQKQVPLVRLSEMYFIAMECAESFDEVNRLYKEFAFARDVPEKSISNPDELRELLVQEYNKEFYGEGQMFFSYKRWGRKKILWSNYAGNSSVYVLPLPLEEGVSR